MGKKISFIPPEVMGLLTNAHWKGNVRELANCIERAVILSSGAELEVPDTELLTRGGGISVPATSTSTFREAESTAIIEALKATSGRVAGQRRSGRTARSEANDSAEQDEAAQHLSRRLLCLQGSACRADLPVGR